ncbi:hypothetical protein DQ04_03301050 [Trypanosoma grayi]|uniref:hypothetical protein n=1 Tax=Trypanosoma grayi TaxID=71804 RepID=UPI0004F41FF8|nr:hypothetical protein DQ04_03301050 [Trypanosoma grayi]KEG10777.1 hypothetical protein DQ04_03301050 [Trypanosoma grayi]
MRGNVPTVAGGCETPLGGGDDAGPNSNDKGIAAEAAPRPSRRALHRHTVKKFMERRKNEERRRLAEERDGKLLHFNSSTTSRSNSSSSSESRGSELSRGGATAKPVLVARWDFDFFFRTMPSEFLQTSGEASGADATSIPPSATLYDEQEQSLVLLGDAHQRPARGSVPVKAMMQSSITRSIHVRRVEGVPPLPMAAPMPPGTDLDVPTRNYLMPDATYYVHQHALGFERDENVAKRSMLACAVREWRGGDNNVLVLSTGDALRSVFEATYSDAKPLALEVRRVGPILLIDSHSERDYRVRVRDLRGKALLGKALYRIQDGSFSCIGKDDDIDNNHNNNGNSGCGGGNSGGSSSSSSSSSNSSNTQNPGTKSTGKKSGVVALPTHRVGSAALSKEIRSLSRYAHIFRWEIGSMDVLVGLDTPIVLDSRDDVEYVLKLEDTSVEMTPHEAQQDALRCWFDATLANVPQVGIFVHNDGVIQRYEVKKVQEMLGIVEGSLATAAMNFTTNVLQWLVSQCVKDGMTYAVIRNYETGVLEIYEYSNDERLEKFLPEDGKKDSGSGAETLKAEEQRRAEESERLNWGLATMCFRMGMHLKDSEAKAPDALSLLLRSFSVYFQHRTRMDEACQRVCDIVKCLPGLVGRLIDNRKAALEEEGGIIQLPEIYREAFLTCGRFEVRLQGAACDETLRLPTRRTFLQCLLPCSAALCLCVARTIEQFCAERRVYLRLRAESGTSSNVHIHSLIAKDLLQVVVEGLLRLEQMNRMLKSDTVLTQCMRVGSKVERMALIDTKTEILDVAPLETALWELYSDVVLLVMSDRTPFTAQVLVELSRRIKAREEKRNSSGSGSTTGPAAEAPSETTLTWLSAITPDVVTLSFTALRFLTKVGLESKRLLSKTAQVYYHVGHHYLLTDRYTKALESLHRAQSLFKAMQQAPADDVFGGCCTSSATVTIKDVQFSLGEVYIRMARLKSRLAPAEVRLSLQQPLAMGETQTLSSEEETFYRHAVDHFTNCEAHDQLAAALRVYATRQIAHIASSGQQADVAKGRHIYSMLRRASELAAGDAALDWEVLRLSTCSMHHAALQRRAEEIAAQWGRMTVDMAVVPHELIATVHPLEFALQMGLVSVSLLEAKKKIKTHQATGLMRGCAAHLIIALNGAHAASKTPSVLLSRAAACWKAECVHEWVYRVALMMSVRAMRLMVRHLPGDKAAEAKQLLQRLVGMEEGEVRNIRAKDKSCGGKCHFWRLSRVLVEAFDDVLKW